jgi:hypothetical protein
MNALDLLHRTVTNQHGDDFHVAGMQLDASSGRIVIALLDLDDNGDPVPGSEFSAPTLDGWQVH